MLPIVQQPGRASFASPRAVRNCHSSVCFAAAFSLWRLHQAAL